VDPGIHILRPDGPSHYDKITIFNVEFMHGGVDVVRLITYA
jgi:hypothetical protein